ncbi:MAG: hypothetical protein CL599_05805 [Alteromonas sp.]|nr:hypothetical protein [Alteromonas sp.]OUX89564.1 MAG: hypothetical protein CBB95_05765 [Alteromonas sp. TMED35]
MTLNAADYFKPQYKKRLTSLVKEVLTERPGITLHSLSLEIANLHGLTRTSKKQIDYIREIVEAFAGINENEGYSPTVWLSPEDRVDLIEWRGVDAFGFERKWNELAYEEALGLAKFAVARSSDSPVDVMCDELKLKRRYETTLSQFNRWIVELKEQSE